eukprot:CAMPEP_0170507034 /NCGR_PEP_ID=MMETSP0208-20121228/57432_1 /TAXON_ID=197538 /ORGANISM="Strombidium inclinatum, Strain S3" /LENGTH=68 /DNA_ID=CAMNT_0010788983 /DNA_START=60 /DNA_END=262 /DNA_ORIENTATION=-
MFEKQKGRLADQDYAIEQAKTEQVEAHKKMEETFDSWFKTVNAEQGRVRKVVTDIDQMVKEKNQEVKS